MGAACTKGLSQAQSLTEDLRAQLEAVEAFLQSDLVGDLQEHVQSLEDAYNAVLTLNLSSVKATESKKERKRVEQATVAILQRKADYELATNGTAQ